MPGRNDLVEMAKPRKKHQDQPRKKLVDKERKKTKAKKEKQPLTTKASIVPGTHGAERTEAESKKEPCTKPKPAHSSLFWRLLLIVATALLAIPVAILVTTRGRPQEVYQLLQNEGLFDRDLWKAQTRSELRRFAKRQISDATKSSISNRAAIRARFLEMDIDQSGNVTLEEASMAGMDERTFDEAEMDDDEDDVLLLEEFTQYIALIVSKSTAPLHYLFTPCWRLSDAQNPAQAEWWRQTAKNGSLGGAAKAARTMLYRKHGFGQTIARQWLWVTMIPFLRVPFFFQMASLDLNAACVAIGESYIAAQIFGRNCSSQHTRNLILLSAVGVPGELNFLFELGNASDVHRLPAAVGRKAKKYAKRYTWKQIFTKNGVKNPFEVGFSKLASTIGSALQNYGFLGFNFFSSVGGIWKYIYQIFYQALFMGDSAYYTVEKVIDAFEKEQKEADQDNVLLHFPKSPKVPKEFLIEGLPLQSGFWYSNLCTDAMQAFDAAVGSKMRWVALKLDDLWDYIKSIVFDTASGITVRQIALSLYAMWDFIKLIILQSFGFFIKHIVDVFIFQCKGYFWPEPTNSTSININHSGRLTDEL